MICRICGGIIPDNIPVCPKCGATEPGSFAARPTDTAPGEPAPAQPWAQQPPVGYPPPGPYYGGAPQGAAFQAPPKKNHAAAVALSIIGAAVIIAIACFVVFYTSSPSRNPYSQMEMQEENKGLTDNPYTTGESVTLTGQQPNVLFEYSECTANITLTELIRGDAANAQLAEMGADLSQLQPGYECAVARFEISLQRSDSDLAIIYSGNDFSIEDIDGQYSTSRFNDLPVSPLRLEEGETGELTIYAIVSTDSQIQAVYYMNNNDMVCFAD
ncbi:MAG TPA: hypothetical protein IAA58_03470 [Candidatus Gallacutalibacter stercoravium]|nr:hypothetical protein [Candidatus Gallacutalibacter stercoravium]